MLTRYCFLLQLAAMLADDAPPDDPRGAFPAYAGPRGLTMAEKVLRDTSYLYSLVLLVAFISLAAWYSVFNAKKEEDIVQPTVKGPGGKPLPITKRMKRSNGERKIGPRFGSTAKIVFRFLAAIVFASYLVTGVAIFYHAFWHENPYEWAKEGLPWAGEWTVVCLSRALCFPGFSVVFPPSSPRLRVDLEIILPFRENWSYDLAFTPPPSPESTNLVLY